MAAWLNAPVGASPSVGIRWPEASCSQRYASEIRGSLDLVRRSDCVDGLIYPDWEAVQNWVEDNLASWDLDPHDLWGDISVDWFGRLQASLGDGFQLRRSTNFLLLHDLPPRHGDLLLTHCERVHAMVEAFLGTASCKEGHGPIGIFQAGEVADFYRYADAYFTDDEGQMPSIGGLFIQQGYGHVALSGSDLLTLERVVTHELAHAAVQHQGLPLWLDEALAMGIEGKVHGESMHADYASRAGLHGAHWDKETIQGFWTGASFRDAAVIGASEAGEVSVSDLSYVLATQLFQRIYRDIGSNPEQFARFVDLASWEDAGERACRECIGVRLGELADSSLGPGDWSFQGTAPADP